MMFTRIRPVWIDLAQTDSRFRCGILWNQALDPTVLWNQALDQLLPLVDQFPVQPGVFDPDIHDPFRINGENVL